MGYSLSSIAKGSLLYTSGQVLTKASAFLLIPLYTRYLTPEDYGIIGYLQFILQISSTIFMFGFHGAQTRFFYQHKTEPNTVGEYLFSINLFLSVVLFLGILLTFFRGESLYSIIGPSDIPFQPFVPIVILTIFFQVMNQLVISFWVAKREYLKTTILQVLLFVLITGFAVSMVVGLRMGPVGMAKAMLYGEASFFIISYYFYARHFSFQIRSQYIIYSLNFGVPVVVHLLSGVMHSSIDRAILANMVSVSELGLYTLGYQVGMVMSIVTSSINKAWQPSYYDLMESRDPQKDEHIRRSFNLWLIVMSLLCMFGMLWGGDILKVVTPESYYGSGVVIPYVLLGYFFHGIYYFAVSPIFFYRKVSLLPWFTGSAAVVNIGLNLLFIPYWGIVGAALATTISMMFQAAVVYAVGRTLHDHRFNLKGTIVVSFVMVFSLLGTQIHETFLLLNFFRLLCIFLLCFAITVYFKEDVRSIIFLKKQNADE